MAITRIGVTGLFVVLLVEWDTKQDPGPAQIHGQKMEDAPVFNKDSEQQQLHKSVSWRTVQMVCT